MQKDKITQPFKTNAAAADLKQLAFAKDPMKVTDDSIITSSIRSSPQIVRFANAMEFQLRKNDERKGNEGWRQSRIGDLQNAMRTEMNELDVALYQQAYNNTAGKDVDRGLIVRLAANVANYAMMIADNEGALME